MYVSHGRSLGNYNSLIFLFVLKPVISGQYNRIIAQLTVAGPRNETRNDKYDIGPDVHVTSQLIN